MCGIDIIGISEVSCDVLLYICVCCVYRKYASAGAADVGVAMASPLLYL